MSINISYLFYSNLFLGLPYMRIQFFPGSTLFAMFSATKVVIIRSSDLVAVTDLMISVEEECVRSSILN